MSRPSAIVTFGLLVAASFVSQGASQAAAPPGGESDADFLRAGVSSEPLVPAWRTQTAENHDLATALLAYDADRNAGARDAVEPLVGFLAKHPDSAWRPS